MPMAKVSFDKISFTTRKLTKIKTLPAPQRGERLREGEKNRSHSSCFCCVCCIQYSVHEKTWRPI